MRFVIAIVLFLLAFVSIGYGIAQRTILAGPSSFTAGMTTDSSAPITVIDGATLHAFEGSPPFGEETLEVIRQLKDVYGLVLTASDAHTLVEAESAAT